MAKKTESPKSFNEMTARIKAITEELRDPNGNIDNMIEMVEEAVGLIMECKNRLAETGLKVNDALSILNEDVPKDSGV